MQTVSDPGEVNSVAIVSADGIVGGGVPVGPRLDETVEAGCTVVAVVGCGVSGRAEFTDADGVGGAVCVPALGCGGVDAHALADTAAATTRDQTNGTRRCTAKVCHSGAVVLRSSAVPC
jgi:hypothetical protein